MEKYHIKYEIHCRFENFFDKEIFVKDCMSKIHAKAKLHTYIKKKYGLEFCYIIIKTCNTDTDIYNAFENIFGSGLGQKSNPFNDMMKNILKKTKK